MGVADNKTYKDMYHFNPNFFNKVGLEELPSLNVDPKLNVNIKDNPFRSNVEIEKDEVVLQPDMSALFKARGKTHKNGGIQVNLRPNSFVFSNDKSMNISDKEHKLFELKEGGKTPAEVLKKNIDIKHYNRMIANITDVKKDDLAKKSSAMMLEKYIGTLGNIAYIQENKKNFPDGIPEFSQGTAPVYNAQLKDEIMEQKQYAKYGGNIKAQTGKYFLDPTSNIKQDPYPDINAPFQFNNKWYIRKNGKMVEAPAPSAKTKMEDYLLNPANPYVNHNNDFPVTVDYTGRPPGYPDNMVVPTPPATVSSSNKSSSNKKYSGVPRESGVPPAEKIVITPGTPSIIAPPKRPEVTLPKVSNIDVTGNGVKTADWQFTPWQKISHAWNAAKYASLKRYDPYRSRFNPSYVDPYLANPEQIIGDIKGAAAQQVKALNTLNPILRNAQAQGIYGQELNAIPGVRSQVENQNVGISNQFKQYNNQVANTAEGQNMQNDQQYYQQSVIGRQNFDNMKTYLGDQWMNNILGDVTTNQTLAYNLLTQKNPAYRYDFRNGKLIRNPKSILDASSNEKGDLLNTYLSKITGDWDKLSSTDKVNLLKVMVAKGFTPSEQKKGGKVFRPQYK